MRNVVLGRLLLASVSWTQAQNVGPAAPPPTAEETRANVLLNAGLGDKNPDVRKQAVAALGLIGPREPYISQINNAISDKDVYVRLAAVASLVDLKDKGTADLLDKALHDTAAEVSFAAAKALFGLDDPRGRAALIAILEREAKTHSNFLTAERRDTLRLVHIPKGMMLFAIKNGIGFAPVPGLGAGVSSMQEIMADNGVSGRATTAMLLATDQSPQVLDALKEALSDKDASVRAAVAHAIALRNDPALMPQLLPLFDDPKEAVRLRAAAGYLRLAWIAKPPPSSRKPVSLVKKPLLPAASKKQ
ncbi:MAG: HEAT repeat domain-containing protein [Acidobacteriota bacterium]|nr:HEAT repeat domain-containing protein [Acidobacteriota bacterium]